MTLFGEEKLIGLAPGSRPSVMIAEPREDYADALRIILQNASIFDIIYSTDAFSAVEKLSKRPVDLLLCSFDLHPINAIEFVKGIRGARRGISPALPIIITADSPTHTLLNAVRAAGADGLVAKPIVPTKLYAQIRIALGANKPCARKRPSTGKRPVRRPARRSAGKAIALRNDAA